LKRIGYYFFGLLCIAVGLYPIIYFIIDRRFGLLGSKTNELLSDTLWNIGFYGHITLGGLALLIGWLQFNKKLRLKNLKLHKRIGKVYVASAITSGLCGLYIAFYATGGTGAYDPCTGLISYTLMQGLFTGTFTVDVSTSLP